MCDLFSVTSAQIPRKGSDLRVVCYYITLSHTSVVTAILPNEHEGTDFPQPHGIKPGDRGKRKGVVRSCYRSVLVQLTVKNTGCRRGWYTVIEYAAAIRPELEDSRQSNYRSLTQWQNTEGSRLSRKTGSPLIWWGKGHYINFKFISTLMQPLFIYFAFWGMFACLIFLAWGNRILRWQLELLFGGIHTHWHVSFHPCSLSKLWFSCFQESSMFTAAEFLDLCKSLSFLFIFDIHGCLSCHFLQVILLKNIK